MCIFQSAVKSSLWFPADAVKISLVEKLFHDRLNGEFPVK